MQCGGSNSCPLEAHSVRSLNKLEEDRHVNFCNLLQWYSSTPMIVLAPLNNRRTRGIPLMMPARWFCSLSRRSSASAPRPPTLGLQCCHGTLPPPNRQPLPKQVKSHLNQLDSTAWLPTLALLCCPNSCPPFFTNWNHRVEKDAICRCIFVSLES